MAWRGARAFSVVEGAHLGSRISDSVTSSACSHDVFPGERHRAGTGGAAGPQVVAGVSGEPGCPHAA